MKRFVVVTTVVALTLLWGCGDKETQTTAAVNTTEEQTVAPDTCLVAAKTLSGNRYLDFTAKEQVLLRATDAADWQLEVYDLFDCTLKTVYQLPENFSPDYPYYLADINYNTTQRMVGIRGYKDIFVVDLDREERSESIVPQFGSDRLADVESGVIQHLEVWEDYLVGMTQDWGAFVFSLEGKQVSAIEPVADLEAEQGGYRSLFLIKNANGDYQAILPTMSEQSGEFQVNPLFAKPQPLKADETVYAEGSPYVRLQQANGKLVGVNLYTGELLPVIEEVE